MSKKIIIGILGGMGSPAGAWLFNRIVELCTCERDQDYPEIIVHSNSEIPDRTTAIAYDGESPLPELLRSVELFNDCQVSHAVVACMTAHYYMPFLQERFKGRFINAIDCVIDKVREDYQGVKVVGLIGSTGLLKTALIQDRLVALGIETITLNDQEQEELFMQPIYGAGGMKSGINSPWALQTFRSQLDLFYQRGAELVIGACSEVPLAIEKNESRPFIDAFDLLAYEIVKHYKK